MNITQKIHELGKADLHIHSNYSDARPSIEEILEYVEQKTELDVVAITDHDTIDGALYAKKIMAKKKYRFELIIGEEISTSEGHVIGLFLAKAIKPGLSAKETLGEIKKQNAIALMPHPLRHIRVNSGKNVDGVDFMTLIKEKKNIDALEALNGTPTFYKDNIRATFFNDTMMQKAEIGSSDAHILAAIGMGFTLFEGHTSDELREAIRNNQTRCIHKKWRTFGLIKYLFFFLPSGFRLFLNTLIHGRNPKHIQLINLPKKNILEIHRKFQKRSTIYAQRVRKSKNL